MPDAITVIEAVLAPLLHRRSPVAVVESVDVPLQLSTTFTTGVAGIDLGAAVPLPASSLIQPSTVVVTVYIPGALTVMKGVDSPVFHNKEPGALVESVDVPLQLSTTFTTGVAGVERGAAIALPSALVHPSTVVLTVYVPGEVAVIEGVDSPVLHNNVPGASVESVDVPVQLLTTFTTGVAGVVLGLAIPLPSALVQPLAVVVTVYVPAELTVIVGVDSPVLHNNVPVAVVERVDVPLQLSTTFTTGVVTVVAGAAVALPSALVQPSIVVVTV